MAKFERYSEHWRRILPPWLRGNTTDKVWTAVFDLLDAVKLSADQAMKAHFIERAPIDAVNLHGKDCEIERLPGESTEAYRLRLLGKWEFKRTMSTRPGLPDKLRQYIGPSVHLFDLANDGWTGGVASGEDFNTANWSRIAMVIEQPHAWVRQAIGSGLVVGPETIVGVSMTRTELSRIRRLFRIMRPAHVVGIDIFVVFDSTSAPDVAAEHASADAIKLPLGPGAMVGYPHHGMTVGDGLIVGQEFT